MGGQKKGICPICREAMNLTDRELQPCICGHEICLWCWHFIIQTAKKDGSDARCPACRSPYDKERILKRSINKKRLMVNANKQQTLQKTKQITSDVGKDLHNIRVVRRNIVYIAGIPKNLSDEKTLMKKEYLGQYGKIIKIFFTQTDGSRQYYSSDSFIVYVTFSKEEEALRCIQVVNGYILDGRPLRASFGTTRYCYSWLKNLPCKNSECLYVHDVVSEEDICQRDEVVPFCTSKLQQCSGLTFSNLKQHSGSFLPPPLDTKSSLPPLGLNRNNSYMKSNYFGRSYASVAASDNQSNIPTLNDVPATPSTREGVNHEHVSNEFSTPRNEMPLPKSDSENFAHAKPFVVTGDSKIASSPNYKSASNTSLFTEDNTCKMSFPVDHILKGIVGEKFFSDSDGYSELSTCRTNVTTHASSCSNNYNADKWKCETGERISNNISLQWDDFVYVSSKFNPCLSLHTSPGDSTLPRQDVLPSYDSSRSSPDLGSEKFSRGFEDERLSITKLYHKHNISSAIFPTGSTLVHVEQKNLYNRSSVYNDPNFDPDLDFPQADKIREEELLDDSYINQSEDSILSDILALDFDSIDDPTQSHSVIEFANSDDPTQSIGGDSKSYFSMTGLYGSTGQFSLWSNSTSGLNKYSSCPKTMERKEAYLKHSGNKFGLETPKNSEVHNGITLLSASEAADASRSSLEKHCSGAGYSFSRATQRTTLSAPPGFPPIIKTNQGSTSQCQQHNPSAASFSSNPNAKTAAFNTWENSKLTRIMGRR